MIGRAGARRMAALLVIGDAVLVGVLAALLGGPTTSLDRPAEAVTATTAAPAAVAPPPGFENVEVAADRGPAAPTIETPAPTAPSTSAPSTTTLPPPTTAPAVASSTTVPVTAPPPTTAPTPTAPPPTTPTVPPTGAAPGAGPDG